MQTNRLNSPKCSATTTRRTGHGVYGLERHDLGCGDVGLGQQLFQVSCVVVAEQVLRNAAVEDAVNHRRVVADIGKYLTLCNTPVQLFYTYVKPGYY